MADEEEYVCEFCNGQGGVGISGFGSQTGSWVVRECDCCHVVGQQSRADFLNAREAARQKGVGHERIKWSLRERAFYEEWAKQNRQPSQGFNYGMTTLQLLLAPIVSGAPISFPLSGTEKIPDPQIATERDYLVAATIIQWLGSNIGTCFLNDVRDRIAKLEEENKHLPGTQK